MAFRNSSGTNEIPRLVVKIVGGKQVKYFIEEPERQREDQIQDSGPDVVDERMKEGPVQQTLQPHSRLPGFQAKLGIVPHGALDMARDRLCFTAPSGDRTFSYIHQRNRLERTDSKATAGVADITEQGDLSEEGQEEDWLCLAIREELCDWPASSLRGIEEKLVALDPSLRGTLKQSQIVDVFLNKEVPLKLPSFHLLLKAFSDVHDPDKVHYKGILRFIQRVVFPQELQECSQSEAGHVSHSPPVHRDSVSVCSPDSINNAETNTWLQRFQRLERAMHLSDRNNTGYMDKDMAKRLLQNYKLILDLNLSSLRINEVTCGAKSQRKVHLDSALHYLKQL